MQYDELVFNFSRENSNLGPAPCLDALVGAGQVHIVGLGQNHITLDHMVWA